MIPKLRVFKTPFKGMPLLLVVTALNAATFWPMAYDFIDAISEQLGMHEKYSAFYAMPTVFYVASALCWIVIGSIAIKLTLSIASLLAVNSHYGNGNLNKPNTVTAEFKEKNESYYRIGANVLIVFITTFAIGVYSLDVRFEEIELKNMVTKHCERIENLSAKITQGEKSKARANALARCR